MLLLQKLLVAHGLHLREEGEVGHKVLPNVQLQVYVHAQ
jgi:hypothetical protein